MRAIKARKAGFIVFDWWWYRHLAVLQKEVVNFFLRRKSSVYAVRPNSQEPSIVNATLTLAALGGFERCQSF